ncbi:MAG: aldo/keto reductase [Candidatus Xenobia bacterium]
MPAMMKRPLGRTGMEVSCVGLGGAGIGGEFGKVKEPVAMWTTRKAMAAGMNLVDVSPAWGESEAWVGKALTRSERERAVLSTKLVFAAEEPYEIEQEMEASIRQSLERLRSERIDVLGLHRFVFAQPRGVWAISLNAVLRPGGYLDCMRKWKEKGVVRALSFTAYGDWEGVSGLMQCGGFDVCEAEYSLLHRNSILEGTPNADAAGQPRPSIIAMAAEAGLGVLGIRPLAGGALAGKATGNRGDAQTMRDRQRALVLQQRFGDTPLPQAAITFALMEPHLASVLVGCRQTEEVDAAAQWSRLPPHADTVLAQLEAFHDQTVV